MAAARSLALGTLVLVSLCGTARASDSNLDLALWNYWQGQGPGATVLSNRPLTYSNTTVVAPTNTPTYADAYINLDGTRYPDAFGLVNSGTIAPWYQSPAFTKFFGPGGPTQQDVQTFSQDVFQKVENIYSQSGLGQVRLTNDPNAVASHTISVIGGATFDGSHDILGMTYNGGSGFSYLDNFQNSAIDSTSKLETSVARNIAHELMHAFGGDHVFSTGPWIDVATTTWDHLTSSDPTMNVFSPEAAANITGLLNGTKSLSSGLAAGEHIDDNDSVIINGRRADGQAISPVPEPSTWLLIGMGCAAIAWRQRRRAA
jgi:hypothetical protein